jgi:hypothetical protein
MHKSCWEKKQFNRHKQENLVWSNTVWCPVALINLERAGVVEWNQLVNPATLLPADDVHHYIIPPKVTIDQ